MKTYAEKITPNVSDTWRADEIYIKIRGDRKYLFAMMDDETRFWIAQEIAETKDKHDARMLFMRAKRLMGKPTVTYNYNSPINLPKEQWVVLFDNISRRDFLTNQEANILLLIVALVSIVIITKILKTKTKKALVGLLLTLAPVTWVIENFKEFVVLGWFSFFVVICIVIEILLSIGVIAFIIHFYKEIPNQDNVLP